MKGNRILKSSNIIAIIASVFGIITTIILSGAVFFAFLLVAGLTNDISEINFAGFLPFFFYLFLFLVVFVFLIVNLLISIDILKNLKKLKEKFLLKLKSKVIVSIVSDGLFAIYAISSFFLGLNDSIFLPIINVVISLLLITSGILLVCGYVKLTGREVSTSNNVEENASNLNSSLNVASEQIDTNQTSDIGVEKEQENSEDVSNPSLETSQEQDTLNKEDNSKIEEPDKPKD